MKNADGTKVKNNIDRLYLINNIFFFILIFYFAEERCLNFAQFLKAMGDHSQVEKPEKEILAAFNAHDIKSTGYVPASELRHILQNLGDKLTKQEGN